MDIETFWKLIADSLRHSPSRCGREVFLRGRLASRPPSDIVQFQVHLDQAIHRAYTWDLCGAASRIFAGWLSDDGFEYFRLWLVGRGRDVFERAVAEPDTLARFPEISRLAGRPCRTWDSDEEWPGWETLGYLAVEAYEQVTADDDTGFYDAVKAAGGCIFSEHPAGGYWDPRDEADASVKLPTLSTMFELGPLR